MKQRMKCPNCKVEMSLKWAIDESDSKPMKFICFNEDCMFYGIERTNKQWFEED